MAERIPGIHYFSANFETNIAAPLDARSTVVNQYELVNESLPYPYLGMIVAVTADNNPLNNGVYILKDLPSTILNNWEKLAESSYETGTTIESVTFTGTTQVIKLNNGVQFETDINWLELAGNQFLVGVTNHTFQLLVNNDFTGTTISAITGETVYMADIHYGTTHKLGKFNIIVVDLSEIWLNNHFLINLPELTSGQGGAIYKIIVKRNGIVDLTKSLMVYSETNKIYSANVKTMYNNSYFLPLETLESVELIWDGVDFLVSNIVKQEYVGLNPENFASLDNSNYVIRDINDL